MQIYKYVVHMVAHAYGKTATFMPKPIKADNGSGMHTHMSIWKGGKPLFAATAMPASANVPLFHRRRDQARQGAQRLHQPDDEQLQAPRPRASRRRCCSPYSSRNRSASCRIPYGTGEKAKRSRFRFPDALANPYLAYSALLMAGLDGIQNRIHPGDPDGQESLRPAAAGAGQRPDVCGSLREALLALDAERAFLTRGDVFSDDQIDAYMELKWEEQLRWETTPSPVEYDMYYSS
jgi:glutamine synthetase